MRKLMASFFIFGLAIAPGYAVAEDSDASTSPHATLTLKGSGRGFVEVSDGEGNVSEYIDQRNLRLNQPTAKMKARVAEVREEQATRAEEARVAREDKRKRIDDEAAKAAERAAQEAEAKARAERRASFKAYEDALTLPPRDRRTGRYRPDPVRPEGYNSDWRSDDS